ncbi:hypothetical protein ACFB49_45770 [Sphingomonas sp. DBB INV C78]|uniref:hypothetical protein n=1 Tax=Sphingomonas sp. DBB INV C78 TaxID=3349434 RepID=UPI0036D2940C
MARLRSGLAGICAAAVLMVGGASSADAALFVKVESDVPVPTSNDVAPSSNQLEEAGASSDPSNPAQQLLAENGSPAQPSRAGWVPLVGALILVAYRMRRPDGRKRIASAV